MVSKTSISILSFVAGIIGIVILFYPLIFLRIPIENLYELIFSPEALRNTVKNLTSIFIVNFFVFFIIGIFSCKLFKRKFPDVSPYFTIPFTFPIVFGLYFMMFFETGNASVFELFLGFVAVFMPLIAYIAGLFIVNKNTKKTTTTP